MKLKLSGKQERALVRIACLAPLLIGVALLILAIAPRFFYTLEGKPQSDISLFWLLGNTVENCITFFRSEETRVPSEFYFSIWAFVFALLSWLCILLHAIFVCMTALLTVLTWHGEASPAINSLKRYYRLLVPNRVCYALFNLLPLLPAFFPYILQGFYGSVMLLNTPVFYYGIPDPITVGVLLLLSNLLFLCSLSAQDNQHMNLFRLYKTGK